MRLKLAYFQMQIVMFFMQAYAVAINEENVFLVNFFSCFCWNRDEFVSEELDSNKIFPLKSKKRFEIAENELKFLWRKIDMF